MPLACLGLASSDAGPVPRARPAAQRAAAELRKDPVRSDYVIAQAAGCSADTVGHTRRILENLYQIGRVPVSERQRRPMPLQPSRTRAAIAALPPDATYRQIARAAGVSVQAAHRMLKTSPRLADLAAATDQLTVLKVNPLPCAYCRRPFIPARPDHCYCTPECKKAGVARRTSARHRDLGHHLPPSADPGHPAPRIPALPAPPDWSRGLCTTVPARQRTWWSSEIRSEREAAALMCQGCPVLADCTQWSLSLPLSDPAIYGGLSHAERRKARRAWLEAIAAQIRSR